MLERIGKYEVRKEIGRGAMGTVYEGFDPAIGRRVAIKTLRTEVFDPSQLPEVLARFKREAQSAGRLAHPHIVTIYEYGEENGTPYIVMEFMSGTELGVLLSRGSRFPLDEIVRIITQLLGALAVAHESGVVHRDLKPANLFMLRDGSLKVVDFGIAHVEASDLTGTGAMLGTPAYMSPEQVLGLAVDLRSDIFSAGVVFYQLLTGDRPFTGSIHTINQKILQQEPLAPSSLNPLLSAAWDTVVSRAMAKKPAARYESARHFAEAIKVAFQAEHAHEAEAKRKAAEASEHAYREAEERSRVEAMRCAEAERVAREEAEARRAAEAPMKKETEERARREADDQARAVAARRSADVTVAMPPSRSRTPVFAALAVVVVLGVLAGVLYVRGDADKRATDAEAARAAEQRARVVIEEKTADAVRSADGTPASTTDAKAAPIPRSAPFANIAVPLKARVTDLTSTLSEAQLGDLKRKIAAFESRRGSQIAVLMVPTTEPETVEQYAVRVEEIWKLGRKGINDGVLLPVAKNDRRLRIEVGYGLESALTGAIAKRIIAEEITPRFKQGDFYGGINAGVGSIIKGIDQKPSQ